MGSEMFNRAGAGAYKLQTFLQEVELELSVLEKNVGGKSEAGMFQINLETQLCFSNIFLVIITTSILLSNNTGKLPVRKGFQNPHLFLS